MSQMSLGEVLHLTETNTRKVADEYRKKAANCRELSERTPNQAYKEDWQQIAEQWEHLAEIADRNANRVIGAGS
jgi:hypothetical protein